MIIAIHGVLSYVGFDQFWSYADVQEVTLYPVTEIILFAVIGPFALFMIALLFLVAGLLTRPLLERKGPGRFTADRLLRLGVPFAVFTFGLWPLLMYTLYHPLGAAPGSYWDEYVDESGYLDTGPLWFVGVLLIFSLRTQVGSVLGAGSLPPSVHGGGLLHFGWGTKSHHSACYWSRGWWLRRRFWYDSSFLLPVRASPISTCGSGQPA
jgi:hypothetical protein